MSNQGALAALDDDAALAAIASGKMLKHIAAQYGVAKQSLHERLSRHPGWKTAVALQAETFVESATDEAMSLGEGATMPDIARARVKVDTAHKWAAARDPATWGQRTQLDVMLDLGPALAQIAERASERVVSGQHTALPQFDLIDTE